MKFHKVKVQRKSLSATSRTGGGATPTKASIEVKARSTKQEPRYEIDSTGSNFKTEKNSARKRSTEPKLWSPSPSKFQVPSPRKVNKELANTLSKFEDHPLPGILLSQTILKYGVSLQMFEKEDKKNADPIWQLGNIWRNGKDIPVYAARCRDPKQVEQYTAAISGLKGLIIAVNADAMSIPDSSLSFAHKKKRKLGFKGQAKKLRKWGGKRFLKVVKAELKKGGPGDLAPSEVVAIQLDDTNRGRLKCNGVLLINGPRVPKGQATSAKHVVELRKAFDNAVDGAKQIGSDSVTYTGISTGRFNFDPALGGQIAMESMLDALAEGKISRAVGAFWCKPDGSFEGSTAEGAVATLFADPDFEMVG